MGKSRKNRNRKSKAVYKPVNTQDMPSVNAAMQREMIQYLSQLKAEGGVPAAVSPHGHNIAARYRYSLFQQYTHALVRYTDMPDIYDLSNYDVIDVSRIADHDDEAGTVQLYVPSDSTESYVDYMRDHQWMGYFPCLPAGLIDYGHGFGAYFEFLRVDVERKLVELRIVGYDTDIDIGRHFTMDIHANVLYDHADADERPMVLLSNDSKDIYEVYESLRAVESRCTWNNLDKIMFRGLINSNRPKNKYVMREAMRQQVVEMLDDMSIVNSIIHNTKLKRQSLPTIEQNDPSKPAPEDDAYRPPLRVFTYGDDLIVRSPCEPNEPVANVTYTVPSWHVRGHPRHCASGKVTYVSPHTKHRHVRSDVSVMEHASHLVDIASEID